MRFYKQPGAWFVYRFDEARRDGSAVVVWIGACRVEDMGRFPDAARQDVRASVDWVEKRDGNRIVIDIEPTPYVDEAAALARVSELAALYEPHAPGLLWLTDGKPPASTPSDHRGKGVREITTGQHFTSVAEAARKLGLNRDMITRNADGDKRYKHVRGYQFERINA